MFYVYATDKMIIENAATRQSTIYHAPKQIPFQILQIKQLIYYKNIFSIRTALNIIWSCYSDLAKYSFFF